MFCRGGQLCAIERTTVGGRCREAAFAGSAFFEPAKKRDGMNELAMSLPRFSGQEAIDVLSRICCLTMLVRG